MAELTICTYPDPILAAPSAEVENIDEDLHNLISDMTDTLYAAPGLGLAAVQVGVNKRLLVYDIAQDQGGDGKLHVLINPRIVDSEGKQVSENEGCLSVPELRADVDRSAFVRVEGVDETGKPVALDAEGLMAILLQHEIDHLEGVLFLDRISRLKRDLYKRKVKKMLKKMEEE